jgi:hypothetical protein
MDVETFQTVVAYKSPVALFASGSATAAHGLAGIAAPTADARRLISKISQTRSDLAQ